MKVIKNVVVVSILVLSLIFMVACGSKTTDSGSNDTTTQADTQKEDNQKASVSDLSGEVIIDGSSTVFPITEAVAEEFNKVYPNIRVPIGVSGTGGGFKKFVKGEIDICDASRPISEKEIAAVQEAGIEYVEFKVAYDGITVVVNNSNNWVDSITVEDLKKIWSPDSEVKKWSDVNPAWPAEEIKLYGPGTDSGTFEFFTEEIVGKKNEIRKDYTPSEDDNALVQGVAGDKNAMGFFGYSYYVENKDTLKALAIDAGSGAVSPEEGTIKNLSYKPLARPLYIYVNKKAFEREYVHKFVEFYLTEGPKFISEVGCVPMDNYSEEIAKLK